MNLPQVEASPERDRRFLAEFAAAALNLPQVEASRGKHRKTWAYSEMEAQVVAYRANGGWPVPTGRRRINPYAHFSYNVVRSH